MAKAESEITPFPPLDHQHAVHLGRLIDGPLHDLDCAIVTLDALGISAASAGSGTIDATDLARSAYWLAQKQREALDAVLRGIYALMGEEPPANDD